MLIAASNVHAFFPGNGLDRLFRAYEWNQVCAGKGSLETVAYCNARVHMGVAYGRTLPPFELVNPADPYVLQSRSGVFFRHDLNERIVKVSEDSGLRTVVRLGDDVQCQAYAAAPDLVGVPSRQRSYDRLVHGWLNVYTDDFARVRSVRVMTKYGKPSLQFDAVTAGNRLIRGIYLVDSHANASIFSTCDQPLLSDRAHQQVDHFFSSIVGSARRFI